MTRPKTTMLLAAAWLACTGPAWAARSADAPVPREARSWERAMSRSSVMGLQLAMEHALEIGKVQRPIVDCTDAIDPDALTPLFKDVLGQLLTPDEVIETERFWRSDAGAHVAELLMSQMIHQLGFTPSYPVPPLSAQEQALYDANDRGSGARKLAEAMERTHGEFSPDLSKRLRSLVETCHAKTR